MRQLSQSSHRTPLIISEIMYNCGPTDTGDSLAFVELFNTEPVAQDIGRYSLSGDIAYTFPTGTVLAARTFLVVAFNPGSVATHYGIAQPAGPMTGSLPDAGGTVRLRNREGALLLEVNYTDEHPWPIAADGAGHSLVLAKPDYGEASVKAWQASRLVGGSPGAADPITSSNTDAVVINEFLAHSDLPLVDFIELFNTSTQGVTLGGCTLSDTVDIDKYTIPPGTVIPPLGCLSIDQATLGFSLSSHGDEIVLRSADGTRVIDALGYPAQVNGVSMRRYPDGTADLALLATPSPGAPNNAAGMRQEDVVINEIMYHPISGDSADEYLELHNRGAAPVAVGDWRFVDGIDYTIPPGTLIPAGGYLVVARDRARLFARYPQLNDGNTVGDFTGSLADRGERVALSRPDDPAHPGVDFVPVDEVTYNDGNVWGRWTDGGGSSLELVDPRADNRLPMNWAGSDETSKAPWTTIDDLGSIDNGSLLPDDLRVMYLGPGECLLDNVAVQGTNGTTYLNETFEFGADNWSMLGNHSRSSLESSGGFASARSLHVRASDAGTEGHWQGIEELRKNYGGPPLLLTPPAGSLVSIKARARWLAGWPHLTLALHGYWLGTAVRLPTPENLGSPGLANSRRRANNGPAIDAVVHAPFLPAATNAVVVSARLDDPDGVSAATLLYRVDPATNYTSVTMNDAGTGGDARAGDGRFSGVIPAQSAGTLVAFILRATDAGVPAQTNGFPIPAPVGAPPMECVVRYGQTLPAGVIGNYLLWMTSATTSLWHSIAATNRSNEPMDCTFVYGADRVIYNVGARYRGMWRYFDNPVTMGSYSVELPKHERFLGTPDFDIDHIGQVNADTTRLAEGYAFWMARQIGLPTPVVRYIRLNVNGVDRGILHDLFSPGADFCESWYGDEDAEVLKIEGLYGDALATHKDAFGRYKQSRYRWLFEKRPMRVPNDDFQPMYDIIAAATNANNALYDARMSALLDRRRWFGFFAVCGAASAVDHYGWSLTHNGHLYLPHAGGSVIHLYDMDRVFTDPRVLFPYASWPELDRLCNRPVFRRSYLARLKELREGPLVAEQTNPYLDDWYSAFRTNGVSPTPPTQWKNWAPGARSDIANALTSYNVAFAVTNNGGSAFSTTNPIVTLSGTAPVHVDDIRVNGIGNALTWTGVANWVLRVGLVAQGTNALLLSAHDWQGTLIASNTITVTLTAPPPSPAGQIVISEIMYHPPGGDADEYVEFFNRSTNHSFDLRGWRLNGADLVFPGGSIVGPRQQVVAAASLPAYQRVYSNAECVVASYAGVLDNDGETLSLQIPAAGSNSWTTIDSVTYDDSPPWPLEADGEGQSLQLIDRDQDNDMPANWTATRTLSQPAWKYKAISGVVSNGSPLFLGQARFNIFLQRPGMVLVDRIALVTGTVAETGSNLLANGDFEATPMGPWTASGNHSNSLMVTNGAYSGAGCLAVITTGPGSTELTNQILQPRSLSALGLRPITLSYWYLERSESNSLTVAMSHSNVGATHQIRAHMPTAAPLSSPGLSNTVAAVLPRLPQLRINEVMPSNVTAWADNMGQFDPWIEILNADTISVSLAAIRLSNTYANPGNWSFPSNAVLAAGERLLIWADGQTNQSDGANLHAGFILSPSVGSVVLSLAHMGTFLALDAVDYARIGADFSYGSHPDGDPHTRQIMHTPTPGSPNSLASLPVSARINEWVADNQSLIRDPADLAYEDWFELHNPSLLPVNLGGCYLTDNLAVTNRFLIPGGVVIPPGGYLLVWADDEADQNGDGSGLHVNFRLSNNGEAIGLYRPDGTLMDAITFSTQFTDRAEGRWPDGVGAVHAMSPATPGSTNRVLQVSAVSSTNAGNPGVSWPAEPGRRYNVLGTTNLTATNWLMLDTITAALPLVTFTDTNAPMLRQRFYRIQRAP